MSKMCRMWWEFRRRVCASCRPQKNHCYCYTWIYMNMRDRITATYNMTEKTINMWICTHSPYVFLNKLDLIRFFKKICWSILSIFLGNAPVCFSWLFSLLIEKTSKFHSYLEILCLPFFAFFFCSWKIWDYGGG